MSVLSELMEMKSQGINDEEIIRMFKERGVSPKEIIDAFSQARIKTAVSNQKEYQPTIGQDYQTEDYYSQESQKKEIPEEKEYAPQEYSQQEYYDRPSYEGTDTESIIEIAEQVFKEKIQVIQKQTELNNEFRILLKSTVDNLSERVRKIENTMDKLQIAILEKIGSYGENLESIKKEMEMMQDSFGKMVGGIADKKFKDTTEPPERKTQFAKPTRLKKDQ